jgi:FG-GAP-like repeat
MFQHILQRHQFRGAHAMTQKHVPTRRHLTVLALEDRLCLSSPAIGASTAPPGAATQARPAGRAAGSHRPLRRMRRLAVLEPLEERVCLSFSFGPPIIWPTGAPAFPSAVAVGHIDDNPVADLATANYGADTVSILYGTGAGGFADPVSAKVFKNPTAVAMGSIFGSPDVVTADSTDNTVSIVELNVLGNLPGLAGFFVGKGPVSVALADLNSDSESDIITANSSGSVSVLNSLLAATDFGAPVNYRVGAGPSSVAVGDFDDLNPGGSHLDLVTANRNSNTVSLLIGDGMGHFGTAPVVAVGTGPTSVAVGDFDGDHHLDLVTANIGSATGTGTVSVLLGNGRGAFPRVYTYKVGTHPTSVVVADFDRNGVPDLATANQFSNDLSVLIGIGDGRFKSAVSVPLGVSPVSLASGDFNGDHAADLAAGTKGGVSVLLNTTPPPGIYREYFAIAHPVLLQRDELFTTQLAAFTVADPAGDPNAYTTTIDWGDGTTSAGQISEDATGTFTVTGSHSYGAAGLDIPISILFADQNGNSIIASSTASVVIPVNLDVMGDQAGVTDDTIVLRLDPADTSMLEALVNDQVQFDSAYSSITTVTIDGGAGHDTIDIEDLPQGVSVTTIEGDTGVVNVGAAAGRLENIQGALAVAGSGGTTLNLFDQANAPITLKAAGEFSGDYTRETSPIYGITDHDVTRTDRLIERDPASSIGPDLASYDIVSETPYQTRISYAGVANLVINGGSSDDQFIVASTASTTETTINSGGGHDAIDVGLSAGSLDNLLGPLTVDGGTGLATLNLYDQAASSVQSYTVTAGALDRSGAARITFSSIADLVLDTGASNPWDTLVLIQGTAAGTALTVNAGPGNKISIANAAGSLDDIQGPVIIQGQLSDNFGIADVASSVNHTYTLSAVPSISPTANLLTRSGAAPITYIGMDSLQMTGGVGDNTYNIEGLAYNYVTRIYGGGGHDVFNISPQAHDLDNLSGILDLEAAFPGGLTANASLIVNDQGHTAGRHWVFEPGGMVAYPSAGSTAQGIQIYFDLFNSVVANGGSGGNTISVTGASAGIPSTINTGNGDDTVNVGSPGNPLDPIQGALTISGQDGSNTLAGPSSANNWAITGRNSGTLDTAAFRNFQNLVGGDTSDVFQFSDAAGVAGTINGGTGTAALDYSLYTTGVNVNLMTGTASGTGGISNILDVAGSPANDAITGDNTNNVILGNGGRDVLQGGGSGNHTFILDATQASGTSVTGGSGIDTLVGANVANTWALTGINAGNVDGIHFRAIANLRGGTGLDVFRFSRAGALASIDGGGAPANQGDWLDYSSFRTPVTVNLAKGTATNVTGRAGSVSNIQNVRGGNARNTLTGNAQGNILVGGSGADVLVGGSGRSVLIGGGGSDAISGGSGDDILIGGTTNFDTRDAALLSILLEWQRTDRTYLERIADLSNGGGLNRGNKLIFGKTVHDDGGSDVLTGGLGLDWFFKGRRDRITDQQPGEQVN